VQRILLDLNFIPSLTGMITPENDQRSLILTVGQAIIVSAFLPERRG